jgi:dGTP triphosphohydrolase
MNKIKSYAIQMSYEVPSEEKDRATKIVLYFQHLIKIADFCNEHLDLIYTPFKDNPEISPEQVFKARAALRRYRDKVADNFNIFKRQAFKCFTLLQPFSVDTQIVKLTKSFVLSIDDIEKQVNRFIELFSNLESKEFGQSIVKGVDNIKKELAQLKQIIEDRIINHVQDNILARNWVDVVSNELQQKVEKKIPLSIELVNERNKKLEDSKNKQ